MLNWIMLISWCVVCFLAILDSSFRTEPEGRGYFCDVVVLICACVCIFFIVMMGGIVLGGVGFTIAGAFWGVLVPIWFADIVLGVSVIAALYTFRYKYKEIVAEGAISGEYYRYKAKWGYGNHTNMSEEQKHRYFEDVGKRFIRLL